MKRGSAGEPQDRQTTRHPAPRLAPEIPFPPYSYVPGQHSHPRSDPAGHSFGLAAERPDRPDPERWQACVPYLRGIDLFNHGYYWEAHEVWEGLWLACGRAGTTASFLKGLIKLAAAGVKVRAGTPRGVRSHAERARALFENVASTRSGRGDLYMGLSLSELTHFARELALAPGGKEPDRSPGAVVVFDFLLRPQ